jgi:hypothetical protein
MILLHGLSFIFRDFHFPALLIRCPMTLIGSFGVGVLLGCRSPRHSIFVFQMRRLPPIPFAEHPESTQVIVGSRKEFFQHLLFDYL